MKEAYTIASPWDGEPQNVSALLTCYPREVNSLRLHQDGDFLTKGFQKNWGFIEITQKPHLVNVNPTSDV